MGTSSNPADTSGTQVTYAELHSETYDEDIDNTILGTSNNDTLTPTTGNDSIDAGAGDDSLSGGLGDDTLIGRAGDDTLDGGAGGDNIVAGEGSDTLLGGGGADTIAGDGQWYDPADHASGPGTTATNLTVTNSADGPIELWWIDGSGTPVFFDTIQPGASDVQPTFEDHNWLLRDEDGYYLELIEGAPNQTVNYGVDNLNDSIDGGDGDDTIVGQFGDDTITGGAGNDTIEGDAGADTFIQLDGFGNDIIRGGETGNDSDTIDGSGLTGDATYVFSGSEAGNLTSGVNSATFTEIENVFSGVGDDSLDARLDSSGLGLFGNAGSDTIRGGSGADYIEGGADADTIVIEDGFGNDIIFGGETATTGTDSDTLDLSAITAPVTVTFTGAEAGILTDGVSTITFSGIEAFRLPDGETVAAGAAGDVLYIGNSGGNANGGNAGNDTLWSGDGDDSLGGGDGDDLIFAGDGNDGIGGDAGNDTVYAGAGNDGFGGGDGDDLLFGEAGDDSFGGDAGNDTLYGGEGADRFGGGADDDVLYGGTGHDTLGGDDGNDALFGEDGDDTLDGMAGNDSLTGGIGNDTFVYDAGAGADTITDFNNGNSGTLNDGNAANNDAIDLSTFYDDIWELHADQADDGILNHSNDGVDGVDYANNDSFGAGSLTFTGASADSAFFTSENTGVVCFTKGTMIATLRGERPVEGLRPGDLILTRDNGPRPLVWIGQRHLGKRKLASNPTLKPILITPGLVGAHRPVCVSPQHGMLLKLDRVERLVRARHLANLKGGFARVMQGCRHVTYFHLMFDAHEIIFANGALSESFYPGQQAIGTLSPEARHEIATLFPALTAAPPQQAYGPTTRRVATSRSLAGKLQHLGRSRAFRL